MTDDWLRSPGAMAQTTPELSDDISLHTDGIHLRVPKRPAFTQEQLLARFQRHVRANAARRDRREGEPVAAGDDLQLNVIGYSAGKLLPFSLRSGDWVTLTSDPRLPGFYESLLGQRVGARIQLQLRLPAEHPEPSLQGVLATFLVAITAAREVTLPRDADAQTLARLGLGNDLDAVMLAVARELERERAAELWRDALVLLHDEIVRRVEVAIPAALVDEELRVAWALQEGPIADAFRLSGAERAEALDGWLQSRTARAGAERRVRVALGLRAWLKNQPPIEPNELRGVLNQIAPAIGLDAALIDAIASGQVPVALEATARQLVATLRLLESVRVSFEQ